MKQYVAEIGGVQTEILESDGTGAAVFFFHGNSSCAQLYAPLLSSVLGSKYRLVAVSFPGHGGSDYFQDPDSELSIASLGAFTAQVTQHFAAVNYILVGQSLGGHALLESISLHGKAAGLCLISSPPISLEAVARAFNEDPIDGLLFKKELGDDEIRLFAASFIHRENAANLQSLFGHIQGTNGKFREALGRGLAQGMIGDEIAALDKAMVPVAMLRGDKDKFLSHDYYETLNLRRLWSGNVITFPDAGHALNLDDPEYFHDVLLRFLDDVSGARP